MDDDGIHKDKHQYKTLSELYQKLMRNRKSMFKPASSTIQKYVEIK
jgi:hypothetical protein